MKDMFEIAKYYASLGLCVLPVARNTKSPMVNWKEYQTNCPGDGDLFDWFGGKTNQDIGMGTLCGAISNIIVCDDDYHDGNTHLGLSSTMKVRTGNNGIHLFYQYNPEIGNRLVIDDNKIDFRSDSHFVVLPPTIHPNGNEYKWEINGKLNEVIKIMPKFPLDYIMSKIDKPDPLKRLAVKEGGRDDSLFKELCSKVDTVDNLDEFIQLAYVINSEYKPPMDSKQVDIKIQSAWKYRKKPIQQKIEIKKPRTTVELAGESKELMKLQKEAPSTGFIGLDEVIVGFIPTHLYTMTGETNVGKTALACNFAMNVAMENRKVLYVALEPDIGVNNFFVGIRDQKKFDEIREEDFDIPILNLTVVTQEDCPTMKHLEKIIEEYGKDTALIVIDHIGYFITGENNYIQEQSKLIKQIAVFAQKYKTAVLLIAHPRKTMGDGRLSMNDIGGSASFKQDSDCVMILNRIKKTSDDEYSQDYENRAIITIPKKKVAGKSDKSYATVYFTPQSPLISDTPMGGDNYDLVNETFNE